MDWADALDFMGGGAVPPLESALGTGQGIISFVDQVLQSGSLVHPEMAIVSKSIT